MRLDAIVGQELLSVAFVQDYVQLDFSGPLLTLFAWPELFRDEGSYAFGDPGYRDMLCAEIAEDVSEATLEQDVLELAFEDGVILRLSLREEDLDVTEAGHFLAGDGQPLVVF